MIPVTIGKGDVEVNGFIIRNQINDSVGMKSKWDDCWYIMLKSNYQIYLRADGRLHTWEVSNADLPVIYFNSFAAAEAVAKAYTH